ncbi:hypothetical protein BC826DRAFT_1112686 [Russula brevipes]|nr:hypothetical protein BC826DRAFT_1112686 [Russula brevipes]
MSTSKGPNAGEGIAMEVCVREGQVQPSKVTVGTLPDEALLEIFYFYLAGGDGNRWHTLVHVCRRWRLVTFASPCRLNLRLLCTEKTPVKEMLDIWPAFPIIVSPCTNLLQGDADNVFAALERHDRVSSVILRAIPHSLWERFIEVMQGPFQALTHLVLWTHNRPIPAVLPDSFLSGSVPRLRTLHLGAVPFPGLWKLLPSASNLVYLTLDHIPDSMYISPEAMVTCLSALTRLSAFKLAFDTPRSLPTAQVNTNRRTYVDLPTLILFHFTGISGYLEDLVLQINAPYLTRSK